MYLQGLLLGAGLLLLLLLGRREHLEFTGDIKDIRTGGDPTEQARIFALAPTSLQGRAKQVTQAGYTPEMTVAGIVSQFQQDIYVSLTTPVTEEVISNFVATKRKVFEAEEASPLTTFYLDAYSNGDAKALLMAYFGLQAAGTIPPLSTPPTPSSTQVSVPTVLEQMRDNLLEYKMTGESRYKSAYDGAKAWLDKYLADLTTQLARDADSITSDVAKYQNANQDLVKTQTEFQRVTREGPRMENLYLTLKKQMDQAGYVPDNTGYYVKVGIAVALVVGIGVLVFF